MVVNGKWHRSTFHPPCQVGVATLDETSWRPPGPSRMRWQLGPSVRCRVILPKLSIVQGTVVVSVTAQYISLPIGCKLGACHPCFARKIVKNGPCVRNHVVGIEVTVNRQVVVDAVAVAKADVGHVVDAEIERMVSVAPHKRSPFLPSIRLDIVGPPVAQVAVVVAPEPHHHVACRIDHGWVVSAVTGKRGQRRPLARRHVQMPEVCREAEVVGSEADVGIIPFANAVAVSTSSARERLQGGPCVRDGVVAMHVRQVLSCGSILSREHVCVCLVGHRDGMVPPRPIRRRHLNPIFLGKRRERQEKAQRQAEDRLGHGGNGQWWHVA